MVTHSKVIQELTKVLEYKKISIRSIAPSVGMTYQGLWRSMKANTVSLELFCKICETTDINPCDLFQPDGIAPLPMVQEPAATYKSTGNGKGITGKLDHIKQLVDEIKEVLH